MVFHVLLNMGNTRLCHRVVQGHRRRHSRLQFRWYRGLFVSPLTSPHQRSLPLPSQSPLNHEANERSRRCVCGLRARFRAEREVVQGDWKMLNMNSRRDVPQAKRAPDRRILLPGGCLGARGCMAGYPKCPEHLSLGASHGARRLRIQSRAHKKVFQTTRPRGRDGVAGARA